MLGSLSTHRPSTSPSSTITSRCSSDGKIRPSGSGRRSDRNRGSCTTSTRRPTGEADDAPIESPKHRPRSTGAARTSRASSARFPACWRCVSSPTRSEGRRDRRAHRKPSRGTKRCASLTTSTSWSGIAAPITSARRSPSGGGWSRSWAAPNSSRSGRTSSRDARSASPIARPLLCDWGLRTSRGLGSVSLLEGSSLREERYRNPRLGSTRSDGARASPRSSYGTSRGHRG